MLVNGGCIEHHLSQKIKHGDLLFNSL